MNPSMRRAILVGVVALLLCPVAASAQSLVGAWTLEERVVTGGPDAGTIKISQPTLQLFTGTHFSRMYVWPGDKPRPRLSDSPSDAELLSALQTTRAHSGTYQFSGSTLTIDRTLANHPNVAGTSATYQVRLEGNSLWLTSKSADGTVTTTEKWVRVPGSR